MVNTNLVGKYIKYSFLNLNNKTTKQEGEIVAVFHHESDLMISVHIKNAVTTFNISQVCIEFISKSEKI